MYGCLRLTRLKLAILGAMLVLTVVAAVSLNKDNTYKVNAALNQNRVEFIASLGVDVDDQNYTVKSVIIPQQFNEVYVQYNNLQKQAGYDLLKYTGKTVTQYTYYLKDSDTTRVNLLVYKQKVIGGDISSVQLDGQMRALVSQ